MGTQSTKGLRNKRKDDAQEESFKRRKRVRDRAETYRELQKIFDEF